MNILITGGAGYMGSVLVSKLLEKRDNCIDVVDCLYYGCKGLVKHVNTNNQKFRLYNSSILDYPLLSNLFKQTKYDCVIHLASLVGEPLCSAYPDIARQVNVLGTKNLLDVSCRNMVPLFIHSSTCSIYGITKGIADETTQLNPQGTYASTKVEAECLVQRYPFSYVVFRNATLYGMSPRMRFDIIPNQWVKEAYQKKSIEVFEPDSMRPFIHIQDCTEYFVRVVNSSQTVKRRQTFNIGECNVSKGELALSVQEFFPETKIEVAKKGDNRSYQVDFTKAWRELNYFPQTTLYKGLEDLSKTIDGLGNDLDNPIYDNLRGFRK